MRHDFWAFFLWVCGFIALSVSAGAIPWAGDCETFLAVESVIDRLRDGVELDEPSKKVLIAAIDTDDDVLISLGAYALGLAPNGSDENREILQKALTKIRSGRKDRFAHLLAEGYICVSLELLTLKDLSAEERMDHEIELLENQNPYARLWAAKQLIDCGHGSEARPVLKELFDRDLGDVGSTARALLYYMNAPEKGYLPDGSDDHVVILNVVEGRYYVGPCAYAQPPVGIRKPREDRTSRTNCECF